MNKKKEEKIRKQILSLTDGKDYGLCPPPIDPQVAVHELARFFLGDDWYTTLPISNLQVNTEIVMKIEMRYKGKRGIFSENNKKMGNAK